MMILQIATLGLYENERVMYASMKRQVDKLVLISTEKNREEVQERAKEFTRRKIPFENVEVNPRDFKAVLAAILDVVASHPDYDIEFNASCGTRIMAGAAHMAATVVGAPLVFVSSPDDADFFEMTMIGPPEAAILTDGRRTVLVALQKLGGSCKSISDLAEASGYSRSMTTRHVNALSRAGYIVKEAGRPISVAITDIGKIILRVKQIRKKRIWGHA